MPARTANLCFDCSDPITLARWWDEVLDDYTYDEESVADEAWLNGPLGRSLEFLKVPETKTVKNRLHLCLRPVGVTRDEEVERLLGLGATMIDDRRESDSWAVLADPEGNEFCMLFTESDAAGVLHE